MDNEKLTVYRERKDYINALRDELEQLRSLRSDIPLEGDLQELVVNICTLEEEIEYQLLELISIEGELRRNIEQLTNSTEQSILIRRYVLCERWKDICDELHFSYQHIQRLHNNAVRHYYQLFKDET